MTPTNATDMMLQTKSVTKSLDWMPTRGSNRCRRPRLRAWGATSATGSVGCPDVIGFLSHTGCTTDLAAD
ncbi:hypothetical protein MKUB_51410 [Mycobacterium kubicae]|uniref:Uncharacterized protein n=1 Tax=Mycobacterium kubicae TaxID=120959 RepID=A0ABQ1BVE3_9MYCO|nr:hypothetical protein MKUB_51410 [Mycobacterium kubicae]